MLPENVRREFEQRLISGGFSGYQSLSDWLKSNGYEISRSAAQHFGQEFQARLGAIRIVTEQARAITEAVGDDSGMLGDALTRLCQEKAFKVLINMEQPDQEKIDLQKMGMMIAKLNNVAIFQKRWMREIKEKVHSTADDVSKKVRVYGLPQEKAEEIRKRILGIV